MPVPGNEEPGVIARLSSISSAGVPIKKRRFPLVWPSSPPPEETNNSVENRQSSPSQDSSLLNTNAVTSSPGKSDASKNHSPEVTRENFPDSNSTSVVSAQDNMNLSKTKLQEPNITFDFGSMHHVESKEKVIMTKRSAEENIQSHTELHLAPNALAVRVGMGTSSKHQVESDFMLELSTTSGDSVLSLGPKEPLVPVMEGQESEGTHQIPDKLDPSSLSLCLSKEKSVSPCESGDANSRSDDSLAHSDRSNWDLNTTMDAWEGSVDEAAIPKTVVFGGLNESGDIKPRIGLLGVGDGRGKQILEAGEHRFNLPFSSPSSQHYKSEDSLCLSLSPSFCQSSFRVEHSGLSIGKDSRKVLPNSNLPGVLINTGNMIPVGRPIVKSEPCDESAKHDHVGLRGSPKGLLDPRTAKMPLLVRSNLGADNLSRMSPKIVALPKSIKSEPVQDGNEEIHGKIEPMSQKLVGKNVQRQDNASSGMEKPLGLKNSCPPVGLATSSELSTSGDVSNSENTTSAVQKELQISMDTPPVTCGSADEVAAEMVSNSVHQENKEPNANDGTSNTCIAEDTHYDAPEPSGLKARDEGPQDSRGHCEGSISEDEKVNISTDMLDEDSYGSEYESDGNQAPVAQTVPERRKLRKDDDEYEDGEVRDPLVRSATEGSIGDNREAKNVNFGNCDNINTNVLSCLGAGNVGPAPTVGKDIEAEDCGEIKDILIKECVDTVVYKKSDRTVDDGYLQESLTGKVTADVGDEKLMKAAHSLDQSERNNLKQSCDPEMSPGGANNGGQGSDITVVHAADENIKVNDSTGKDDSTLPKTEVSLNGKDAAKDSNSGGSRSRIITLPRASNATSPYKTRTIPEGSFGRERYADFDGEKWHPRRNRDEIYTDGSRKFPRDRIHGQSVRNSRQSYGRGRGRGYSRSDSRSEWDSDRTFVSGNYNGPTDFRFPRHKRTSAVGGGDLECNGNYLIAPDGDLVGSGRGGRKPVSDELPSFRHPSSRRLSPGLRDGPGTRGIQVLRRIPRNISPSRCTGEDGSDLVGLRHGEKFMRGMLDDIREPMFNRPQPPYDGLDSQFVRNNRNFSSSQRRGGPRVRSKSPIRSRTRSPGPWSSPRRGSPDGFNGVPEYSQRRSPAVYRMERIRSPDRPCFPDETVARRRGGSPSYMTRPNELRDMDSGRVHGSHLRSIIPNRSPSDRALPRSTRRFDGLDSQERTENDEFIGGPGSLRSGRFHEISGDGSDERRNFGDRRGIVRPFRASTGGADNENFRCHVEDGPARPFRLCPETDSEFIERSNLRERDFDRRIKDRPVIATRRIRNVEEQEGAYRQGGQVWQEDGFDEGTRGKRRRF